MKIYVRRDVGCNRDDSGKLLPPIVLFGRKPEYVIRKTLGSGWDKWTCDVTLCAERWCVQFDKKIVVGWIYDIPWYRLPQVFLERDPHKQHDLILRYLRGIG